MNSTSSHDASGAEWEQLERKIRDAGRYVVPSEDLRPRVLEAARKNQTQERVVRRGMLGLVAALFVWCLVLPLASAYVSKRFATGPTSHQVQQLAMEKAKVQRSTFEWGLVEVIARLRHWNWPKQP